MRDKMAVLHQLWSQESLNARNGLATVSVKKLEDGVAILRDEFNDFEAGCLADARKLVSS